LLDKALRAGFASDALVNESSKLFAVKPHIGFLSVHDKSRILEDPVPDLLPESEGGLRLNDLKTHPVTVQSGDLGNAIRKIVQSLLPILRIFLVARLSLLAVQPQRVKHQIARWACHFQALKGGSDHFDGDGSHGTTFLKNSL
jgi:hypothetical protein